MKEILVISGKGGTGKTSITAAFSYLAGSSLVVADCDVDAANMNIVVGKEQLDSEPFYSGYLADIDPEKCTHCDGCREVCHFDAISEDHVVDEFSCEGCGYCARVCPAEAITISDAYTGELMVADTRFGSKLIHAKLAIGGENSGKMVSEVKKKARETASDHGLEIILLDGPPGIGCPLTASLSGANVVVIVTEASVSGYSDLVRAHELITRFKLPCFILLNKADMDKEQRERIIAFSARNKLPVIGEIPYDRSFTRALKQCRTIMEEDEKEIAGIIKDAWLKLLAL